MSYLAHCLYLIPVLSYRVWQTMPRPTPGKDRATQALLSWKLSLSSAITYLKLSLCFFLWLSCLTAILNSTKLTLFATLTFRETQGEIQKFNKHTPVNIWAFVSPDYLWPLRSPPSTPPRTSSSLWPLYPTLEIPKAPLESTPLT